MKNMLLLANILVLFLLACVEWNSQKKLTLIHFALRLHDLKTTDHTLKILTVAKVKLLPWKHMPKSLIRNNCQFYSTVHLNRF